MAANIKSISLTHERDAAWLIGLYIAINSGDPAPTEGVVTRELQAGAALHAIAALSSALDEKTSAAVQQVLAPSLKQFSLKTVDAKVAEARLAALGIRITEYVGEHAPTVNVTQASQVVRRYCIRFRGQLICTELKSIDPAPFI
jgi:hypothetical protein